MRIGILQPGYLPWLGFFEQLSKSDVFVIYDDVQYDKNGWRNRNKIKNVHGPQWLTVPVSVKFSGHPMVADVKINNRIDWRKDHLLSIKHAYSKAPYYEEYLPIFEETYLSSWEWLVDLDMHFILKLSEALGLKDKKVARSSAIGVAGDKIERLVRICKMFGADTFYEGAAGKDYIDVKHFADNGINVEFQDYKHPVYKQLHGEFIPYLSVIDLLFNYGKKSLAVITNSISKEA